MRSSIAALAALMLGNTTPSGVPDDARPVLQRCYPVAPAAMPYVVIGSNQAPLD